MPRLVHPHPRDWLPEAQRPGFGRRTDLAWPVPTSPLERAQVEAARRQHALARKIRDVCNRHGLTAEVIGQRSGLSAPAVRAILNGSRHLPIATLYALASAIDHNVTVTLTNDEA